MKFLIFTIIGFLIIASSPGAFAQELQAFTNQQIYTTQHPLLVYGMAPENAPLVLRMFAPDGTIANFEQKKIITLYFLTMLLYSFFCGRCSSVGRATDL